MGMEVVKLRKYTHKGKGHLLGVINVTKAKNQMIPSGSSILTLNSWILCYSFMNIGHGQGGFNGVSLPFQHTFCGWRKYNFLIFKIPLYSSRLALSPRSTSSSSFSFSLEATTTLSSSTLYACLLLSFHHCPAIPHIGRFHFSTLGRMLHRCSARSFKNVWWLGYQFYPWANLNPFSAS